MIQAELDDVGGALPDLVGGDGRIGLIQAVGFVEAEAPVEQRQRIDRALFLALGLQDHADQALVAALGRGQQAIAGAGVVAGLDAVHRIVAPQQQIAVALGDGADGEFAHFVEGVLTGEISDQRAAQQGQIAGGGVMALGRQAGGVDEVGVLQADALGVIVHQRGERGLAAGDVFGQGDRGIVAGLDHHAHFHLLQRRGLVDLEPAVAAVGAGAAGAPGVLAHHHLVGGFDALGLQLRGDHVRGHHLGDAGRFQAQVDVLAGQHLAGGVVHHQPGLGGDGSGRIGNGQRRRRGLRCRGCGGRRLRQWRLR